MLFIKSALALLELWSCARDRSAVAFHARALGHRLVKDTVAFKTLDLHSRPRINHFF